MKLIGKEVEVQENQCSISNNEVLYL
jgi:hypothetical protein